MRLIHSRKYIFLAAFAAMLMLAVKPTLAADDSAIYTRDSASPSSTEDNNNNEADYSPIRLGQIGKSPEYTLSSTSDPNARCRKSSLTQEEFVEMVRAIVKHGDLTDKDFIEKTLKIKFGPMHTVANSITSDREVYSAYMPGDMPEAPIRVSLYGRILSVNKSEKQQLLGMVAFNDLDRVGAVFHNCQYLMRRQLDPKLQAIIHYPTKKQYDPETHSYIVTRAESPVVSASLSLGKLAKNGANVQAIYTFRIDDNVIENISIGH